MPLYRKRKSKGFYYFLTQLKGTSYYTQSGPNPGGGKVSVFSFASEETARRNYQKLIDNKIGEGYEPFDEAEAEEIRKKLPIKPEAAAVRFDEWALNLRRKLGAEPLLGQLFDEWAEFCGLFKIQGRGEGFRFVVDRPHEDGRTNEVLLSRVAYGYSGNPDEDNSFKVVVSLPPKTEVSDDGWYFRATNPAALAKQVRENSELKTLFQTRAPFEVFTMGDSEGSSESTFAEDLEDALESDLELDPEGD